MPDELTVTRHEPTPFSPEVDAAFRALIRAARKNAGAERIELVLIIGKEDSDGMMVKQASTCGPENAIMLMSALLGAARNA